MGRISYRGYRFPPDVIQRAVWLYFRFTLSFRDVEDLLAERGIEVNYETIRQWALRFGPAIARDLCSHRPPPTWTVAFGRDVRLHWRKVDVSMASCRCRRRGS